MYYKLKPQYLMRGWVGLPTGVVDTTTGLTVFLSAEEYTALKFCNGVLDSNMLFIMPSMRHQMQELEKKGFVSAYSVEQEPISDEQSYHEYKNRYIASAHWSITGRCNYKCLHCFMSAPDQKHAEMSFEDCKRIIEDFHNCGVFNVQLTGGEAMVHPQFWEIVDLLTRYHIKIVAIYSNGALVNERFFTECSKRGIKPTLSLSFDGTDGQHEWLRNVPQSLEHITRALDLAKENGYRTVVEFCIHKGNKDTLRSSMLFLQEHGCASVKVIPLADMGRGKDISEKMLDMSSLYDVMKAYIPLYREDGLTMEIYAMNVQLLGNEYSVVADKKLQLDNMENYSVCGHARNEICISPEGLATPCATMMESDIGKTMPNILTSGLSSILDDGNYIRATTFTLGEYMQLHPECQRCVYKCNCAGGCRANGKDQNGKGGWTEIDRDTCAFFKAGTYESMHDACQRAGFKLHDKK